MKATDYLLSLKRETASPVDHLHNNFISDIFRLTKDDAMLDLGQCDGVQMRISVEVGYLLSLNGSNLHLEKMRQAMDIANFIHGCN